MAKTPWKLVRFTYCSAVHQELWHCRLQFLDENNLEHKLILTAKKQLLIKLAILFFQVKSSCNFEFCWACAIELLSWVWNPWNIHEIISWYLHVVFMALESPWIVNETIFHYFFMLLSWGWNFMYFTLHIFHNKFMCFSWPHYFHEFFMGWQSFHEMHFMDFFMGFSPFHGKFMGKKSSSEMSVVR